MYIYLVCSMLQRLARSSRRSHVENFSLVQHHAEVSNLGLVVIDPPAVSKVDHHSIELVWERLDATAKGDKRLKYALEEEDPKTHKFLSVYVGYSDTYKIEGLDPVHPYKYRLRIIAKENDVGVSPTVTVYTTDEPYNSDHLHRATSKGDLKALTKIIASGDVQIDVCDKLGYTPLMNASQKGHLEVVEALLQAHADPHFQNSSGKNSLMLACFGGHEKVAKRLREAGALWTTTDRGGSSAIHWAVDGKNLHLISWMLQDGAPVNLKDLTSGWTPLIRCSALNGDEEVAEVLLRAGADVNAVDIDGKTPLMVASLNGYLNLVKKLVAYEANLTVKTKHGKTALEMAKSFDRRHVVDFLEELLQDDKAKNSSKTSLKNAEYS